MTRQKWAIVALIVAVVVLVGVVVVIAQQLGGTQEGHCPEGMEVAYESTVLTYTDEHGAQREHPADYATCIADQEATQ